MANLTPQQRQLVEQWAAEGANLNQIQDRLRAECATTLTYMETRLLIMELGIKLQEKPKEVPPEAKAPPPIAESDTSGPESSASPEAPAASALNVTVDEVPPPGAIISGRATFNDGITVQWFMDEQGRFGMRGPSEGYQPPVADVPIFQGELEKILELRGFYN